MTIAEVTALNKLRDELAEKLAGDFDVGNNVLYIIKANLKAMWDAAIAKLSEASGEFDEKAARAEYMEHALDDDGGVNAFDRALYLARWQFEQDRARIAHAQQIALDRKREWHKERERANEAEARRAESERFNANHKEIALTLKAELAAAEAELEKLKAQTLTALSDLKITELEENEVRRKDLVDAGREISSLQQKLEAAEAEVERAVKLMKSWEGIPDLLGRMKFLEDNSI